MGASFMGVPPASGAQDPFVLATALEDPDTISVNRRGRLTPAQRAYLLAEARTRDVPLALQRTIAMGLGLGFVACAAVLMAALIMLWHLPVKEVLGVGLGMSIIAAIGVRWVAWSGLERWRQARVAATLDGLVVEHAEGRVCWRRDRYVMEANGMELIGPEHCDLLPAAYRFHYHSPTRRVVSSELLTPPGDPGPMQELARALAEANPSHMDHLDDEVRAGHVRVEEAIVTLSCLSGPREREYYYEMASAKLGETLQFQVSRAAYNALVRGYIYRVYYTRGLSRIVKIEPLLDVDGAWQRWAAARSGGAQG